MQDQPEPVALASDDESSPTTGPETRPRSGGSIRWIAGVVGVVVVGLVGLFVAGRPGDQLEGSPAVGELVPDLAGVTLAGVRFDIDDHRG